jgi:hypothetical protein
LPLLSGFEAPIAFLADGHSSNAVLENCRCSKSGLAASTGFRKMPAPPMIEKYQCTSR